MAPRPFPVAQHDCSSQVVTPHSIQVHVAYDSVNRLQMLIYPRSSGPNPSASPPIYTHLNRRCLKIVHSFRVFSLKPISWLVPLYTGPRYQPKAFWLRPDLILVGHLRHLDGSALLLRYRSVYFTRLPLTRLSRAPTTCS